MARTREAHQGRIDITDFVPADGRATLCALLRLRSSGRLSVSPGGAAAPGLLKADGQVAAHRGGSNEPHSPRSGAVPVGRLNRDRLC
jgi:hypothetical protein